MPNGVDVPGVPIPIPTDPSFFEDPLSFGFLGDIARSIGGFFGFGGGGFQGDPARFNIFGRAAEISDISGRAPIPTPAEGGPPLVTERFEDLPGPFVDPGLGIMPFELRGIPEEPPSEFLPFQPRPIPEPDVLEEDMAVDAPLLSGVGGLPAIFQRTTPIIGGVLGGLAQDLITGFLRAPQELGTAQIPARVAQVGRVCPPERPSTQILRRIFQNTGVRIKLSAAKSLTRQLGLQAAANCLRVSITDLCTLIITPSPRRRRGISGSDIRIVKRTARRFQALQEDLSGLVSRRRAAPRRRPRHVHALAHTAPGGT